MRTDTTTMPAPTSLSRSDAEASLSLMDSAAGSMGRGTSVHSMDPPMDRMRIAFIDPFGYSSTGAAGFDRHGRCPKDDIVWRSPGGLVWAASKHCS